MGLKAFPGNVGRPTVLVHSLMHVSFSVFAAKYNIASSLSASVQTVCSFTKKIADF